MIKKAHLLATNHHSESLTTLYASIPTTSVPPANETATRPAAHLATPVLKTKESLP
jgi:hypothetical protein